MLYCDKGPVPDTGKVIVLVIVSNDISPVSDTAQRGQFVGKVTAIDPDIPEQDKMRYSTIGENKNQVSSIEESSKILDLVNLHNFDTIQQYLLNVSVTVKVAILLNNRHYPYFHKYVYKVKMKQNVKPV